MAIRQILAMKRAALQSRIEALSAKDMKLANEIDRLRSQSAGLNPAAETDQFQVAAMAADGARRVSMRLQSERQPLQQEIEVLAREKLALDLADKKLADEEKCIEKLQESRADLRA